MDPEVSPDAIRDLGKLLGDARFRREFHADPYLALSNQGIGAEDIPEDIVWAVAELSTAEMRLLGDILDRVRSYVDPDRRIPL